MNRKMFLLSRPAMLRSAGIIGMAAATILAASPVKAQETEVDALRRQIEELSQRLQKIEEERVTEKSAAKSAPGVTSKFPLTISGLLQVRSDAFFSQQGPGSRNADTFRLRRGEIRITAPKITDRISATAMFDITKTGTTGSSLLQELQLSYLLKKAASGSKNNIYIDAGQFKLPIGYEGDLVSSSALQTIERALMFAARDPFGGGYGDIRDTGIQLRGTMGQFEYRLGAFNGLGERQSQLASSDTKAIVGRVVYRPKGIDGLQLGISGARGNTRNVDGGERADRSVMNAFAVYQKDKLTLQTEYLTGKANLLPSLDPDSARDIRGYYASAGYKLTPKIEGVLRYDYFNFDRNAPAGANDTTVRDITLGLNYYIKGNNAKIQANIVRRNGGSDLTSGFGFSSNARGFSNDRTEFRLQGQVAF